MAKWKTDNRRRKYLDFGTVVMTHCGEGIYINRDGDGPDHHDGYHWVVPKLWPRTEQKFHYSEIRPMNDQKAVDALESVKRSLTFHPMDMSSDKRMAWIYGILVGWDEASLAEMAKKHGWAPDDVQKLEEHHKAIVQLKA